MQSLKPALNALSSLIQGCGTWMDKASALASWLGLILDQSLLPLAPWEWYIRACVGHLALFQRSMATACRML